jgi:hypothetical protein
LNKEPSSILASFTSMDSESDFPRFGNPDSVKSRHALVHTAAAGLALLLGMLQFSARVRRNWPVLHRLSGRLMLIIVAASMVLALAFLFRTGSAAATSGPPRSSGSSSFLSWWACLTRALTVFVMDRSRAERFLLASLALVREGMMHSRSILFLVGLVASGMLTAITPHQALAAPAPQPLVTVVASSTNSAIEKVYYYRGRYYRYRYGGRYYAHRYYNGGRWRYY